MPIRKNGLKPTPPPGFIIIGFYYYSSSSQIIIVLFSLSIIMNDSVPSVLFSFEVEFELHFVHGFVRRYYFSTGFFPAA